MSTLDYYQTHAQDFFCQTKDVDMQNIYQPFLEYLPIGKQAILDVGSGSGRDSMYFANQGFKVTAIDGSQNLIDLAKQGDYRTDWQCLRFDEIANQNWQNQFTGIWACASLLHVPFNELSKLLNDLIYCLKRDGILYASFKYGDGEREKEGRFFCDMNEARWHVILQQVSNVSTIQNWQSTDRRNENQQIWFNSLLKKSYSTHSHL